MAGTRLALQAAPKIEAAGDKEAHQDDGENRGEASTEAGPVEINQGEAIVGLIQRHVAGFVGDITCNGELGVILDVDSRGFSDGVPVFS